MQYDHLLMIYTSTTTHWRITPNKHDVSASASSEVYHSRAHQLTQEPSTSSQFPVQLRIEPSPSIVAHTQITQGHYLKNRRRDEWFEGFDEEPLLKPRRQGTTLSVDPPREFPSRTLNLQKSHKFCFFGVDSLCSNNSLATIYESDHTIVSLTKSFTIAWNNYSCAWTYLVKWKAGCWVAWSRRSTTDFGKLWLPIVSVTNSIHLVWGGCVLNQIPCRTFSDCETRK